ncbi:bifunctional 3-(3-hydroxy-phenyl)propionate/3-hydroxycinnamic acid hydroxylase MhpA [Rhodococcus aetherivorans]|uniref:bifunctional 3-(3-hydroxy-phenyl)propionate/3-hydroxycinnamic acid hydroxylase MhpA n=1 Tax=Rhodococcus aetherivorans TaxID=191292 RepID=UPI00163A110B|nr:bifunctional 3-(3-hydroxy-phenyl)propionate/3-hydroxycinnamic acid hydroxylase [Rhodococcus aetherivorans]MBC2592454.1 bifunctional 3-(3-hydroxy-phenyl)propionate/3-hydroxycinnamic acid hydroxylase [Rhodococcus aetherivorans]
MIKTHYPVVVVGAGPTGITAATLLAQYGIDTLVLDRWEEIYPQPRAVHLDDEVYRIVARLGLADDFARLSRPGLGLRLVDRRMRVLAEFSRENTCGIHGFPQANMFDQPEFEQILRSGLSRYDSVHLHGNSEVTAVFHGRDHVVVKFIDRDSGEPRIVRADYVLGCDGANSTVRSSIGSRMQDLGFEQRWLVVDIATDMELHQWEGVHQVCDPARAATYMRIGHNRYRWEFRLQPDEDAIDYPDLDALRPLIDPWTGHVPDPDLEVVRIADYTFRAQVADRWRDRRVFLLGDAAHLTPPFIGQGMGAGLRDAANLAWKLAGVLDGTLPGACLDTYQQERKRHTQSMIRLAIGIGRAMTAGGEFGNLMRGRIAPLVRWIPGLSARVTDSATPALCPSAFVHRKPFPGYLAGALCPNVILDIDGHRFDDATPALFMLVTAIPPTEAQRYEIERRGAFVVPAPPDSALGRWLASRGATVAIVRPDRTVMRAGRSLSALYTMLPALYGNLREPASAEPVRLP